MARNSGIAAAKLRELRHKERKRLEECRTADFRKGRVTHSAATDDALSRFLLLDELLSDDNQQGESDE